MLNRYGQSGQPCLVSDFSGIALSFHSIWCWLSAGCIFAFICLGTFLVSLISAWCVLLRNVGFCRMLFQHLMRWSYVYFYQLFTRWISLTDFHMLNHPCIYGMKPTWLWWIFLMFFWIWFASNLLSIFASLFVSEIGL